MKKKYDVVGMTCSACSAHVDKAVRGLDGVDDVNVNVLQNSMTVEFIENKIQVKSRYIELSMIGIYILLFVICYSNYIAVCFGSTII